MATAPSSSSPSSPATAPSPTSPSLPVTAPSSTPSSPVTASINTSPPPSSSSVVPDDPPSAESVVDFLALCHKLKTRKGTLRWLRSDAENPETIADHMYGMTLMALIAPDVPGLDRNKCIKMAIIHDTAEVMILDTTRYVQRAITHQRGQATLYNMCRILGEGEGSRGKEITDLWMDYEANSSPEAKFVKDLDKLWYPLSKTLAEKAAWEFSKQNGLDVVVVNPGTVMGPIIPPRLNASMLMLVRLLEDYFMGLVHFKDVALAHILVYENKEATGRHLCVEAISHYGDFAAKVVELYPEYNVPR